MGDLINYNIYVLYGFIQLKESTTTHDNICFGFDKFPLIFISIDELHQPHVISGFERHYFCEIIYIFAF